MENKIYEIQGEKFSLLPNDLNLLNKAAPMIAKLRKLSYEYTKDIDLSGVNEYKAKLSELNEAKEQLEEMLSIGKDEDGMYLTNEKKSDFEKRVSDYDAKIKSITAEFNGNVSLQNLLKLKHELEGYALVELLTDTEFLKPVLKKILTGGRIEAVDFSGCEAIAFVRDVITDFFTVMNRNSLKL